MPKIDWTRKLAKPIDAGRKNLRTLHDVRAHILSLPEPKQEWSIYQNVARNLMEASNGGSTESVNASMKLANMMDRGN
jgi:hypothetical protein